MDRVAGFRTYVLITLVLFYAMPFAVRDTGGAFALLIVVLPASVFLLSFFTALKWGFCGLRPLLTGIFFLPAVFLFYNESAWVYVPGYAALALAGEVAALLTGKLRR